MERDWGSILKGEQRPTPRWEVWLGRIIAAAFIAAIVIPILHDWGVF